MASVISRDAVLKMAAASVAAAGAEPREMSERKPAFIRIVLIFELLLQNFCFVLEFINGAAVSADPEVLAGGYALPQGPWMEAITIEEAIGDRINVLGETVLFYQYYFLFLDHFWIFKNEQNLELALRSTLKMATT
ncbi:Hypothetical predicted protein [Pelobates cultripes]|uniref:Uncharacterized protein n=1 Tax=Pelobates cultripes TaxID=61616 RepID=A0AAD1W222_PELCU|nr:Hypothetical predicted protein [Pelobates cultripes]